MSDIFSDSLDAIYDAIGVPASISGYTEPVTVVDKTAGTIVTVGKVTLESILPVAAVRVAELTTIGVPDVASLIKAKATITFNGKTWVIIDRKARPTPLGEAHGEVYLVLRNVGGGSPP